MSDDFSAERRQAARIPVAIPIELRDERGFSLYSTHDLSSGGAYFDRAIPHAVGHRVTVRFTLPGEAQAIVCAGEIVNVPHPTCFGMGVRFHKLRSEDSSALEAFMHELRQKERQSPEA